MSNLTDILDAIQASNKNSVTLAGSAIGTLADFGGAAATILLVVDLVSKFTGEDNATTNALGDLLNNITSQLSKLLDSERADRIAARAKAINDSFSTADSRLANLLADVKAQPPIDWSAKSDRISDCVKAVDFLDYDGAWTTVFDDEVYYSDWWSHYLGPERTPSDPTVFCARYVLPAYLKVLGIFLVFIEAFDPDYSVNYSDWIRRYCTRLEKVHDTMASGIKLMGIPDIDGATCQWDDINLVYEPQSGPYREQTPWMNAGPGGKEGLSSSAYFDPSVEYFQPFGAVDIYSGASTFDKFPPIPNNKDILSSENFHFVAKVVVAAHSRRKIMFDRSGLSDVRGVIALLRNMTESPPLSADPARCWFLREIAYLLYPDWSGLYGIQDASGGSGATVPSAIEADKRWWETYRYAGKVSARITLGQLASLSGAKSSLPNGVATSWRDALKRSTLMTPVSDPKAWW